MQVEHFSHVGLLPKEIERLENLGRIIEAAASDGKLSHNELEQIKTIAFANKKLLSAEIELYSKLVLDKIERGELEYEW
ncbi:MAG: hypothetical protein WCA35_17390 [Kovacikia sp.]